MRLRRVPKLCAVDMCMRLRRAGDLATVAGPDVGLAT